MVLIDCEVKNVVPSLNKERHASADFEKPRGRCPSISMKTYKPHLITEKRRKVEDLCRDLVVNNDHIHIIEMRLRQAELQRRSSKRSLKSLLQVGNPY